MMSQKVGRSLRSASMDGQTGGTGLSSGNPAAERRLATALSKIDREKKKRELAMVWNQRSFFIKQVFDQDNELRFVKAARRPKYLENIPPPPPDGDNSWEKEDYVFSFKPRRTGSSSINYRDRLGKRRSSKETLDEAASKAASSVIAAAEVEAQAARDEAKIREEAEEQERKAKEEQAKRADEERLEKEKRDRSMGVFGSRREKLPMPVLMGGAKSSPGNEKTREEEKIVEGSKGDEVVQVEEKVEDVDTKDEDSDPLNQSKSSGSGSIEKEVTKPKTRFPVLKVRALGLFAMTFKKSETLPPVQGSKQLQSPAQSSDSPDDKQNPDVVGRLPPAPGTLVSSNCVPPQTAPAASVTAAADADIVIEPFPRPGSISLPNSPAIQRKPMVRQKSANAIQLGDPSSERPKTEQPRTNTTTSSKRVNMSAGAGSGGMCVPRKSRQGARRDVTSGQANDKLRRAMSVSSEGSSPPKDMRDKHRRSLSSEKSFSLPSAKTTGSSGLPKVKRDMSGKPLPAAASVKPHGSTTPGPGGGTPLPEHTISNLWAKLPDASESRNRGQENKDGSIPVDDIEGETPPSEEVDVQVIRRIIRTLPSNLMMKTSKREVEAGGEYALFRQRLMDRAKADMTRKAALDPRFMKLEKSLCNNGNK